MEGLVRLAANAVPEERRYVLLAGAGVSRDAGQVTAWDILMETAKLLRAADGGDEARPIEEWFKASQHRDSTYASIIATLYPNPAEQQAFLERQLKVRNPGRVHDLIAQLVQRGVLRAAITTNFDDLLEKALRDRKIDVQIIASDTDFEHASPLIHAKAFRVYKPHGTLGIGQLRNTPRDVSALPEHVLSELQRIVDDHGLLVVGYAGADPAMMSVLNNRRRNTYPVYWLHCEPEMPTAARTALGDSVVGVQISAASTALSRMLTIQDALARLSTTAALVDPLPAIDAIASARKDALARIRDFMSEIRKSLTRLSPRPEDMDNPRRDPYPDELLVESLGSAAPAVVEFAKVAYAAAEHDHSVACVVLREGLHELQYMTHVNRPVVDDDFIDFLVQEMFVILVAGLVKNERWTTLHTLLNALVVDQKGERAPWSNFCRYIKTLDEWRRQRLNINRTSIAADMYHARHQGEGRLAEIAPLHELEDADIFLTFVTGYLPPEGEPEWGKWLPRITLGTERLPPWLARMSSRKYADTLLPLLWMQPTNPDERRSIFKEKLEQVRTINKRVWRMSFLRSPGDFAEKLAERLYSLP